MLNLLKKAYKLLGPIGLSIFSIVIYIFKYRKFKAVPSVKKGFKDHRPGVAMGDARYMTIFKRLLDSYNKAKAEQENIAQPYRVGHMWQCILDDQFVDLVSSLCDKDTAKLQCLLENFHRERFTLHTGGGSDDYYAMKKNPVYKYQFMNTWYKYYNIYKDVAGGHPQLTYPLLGNSVGLYHDGQIIPIEAIRYHYYAAEILSLLQGVNYPVICEIGGGLGGQAYTILSNPDCAITYILLDLPETLIISSYFLMAAFPEKRFLLYGEGSLDSGKLDQYDVILMPNFMLPQLGDEMVDLFFNACSFSEMDSVTVEEYIRQIERICRRYFMHINHNAKFVWYDEGKEIVNMPGSQIRPDPERFKKIYQHPRLFARLDDKVFYHYYKAKHFTFLYERVRPPSRQA